MIDRRSFLLSSTATLSAVIFDPALAQTTPSSAENYRFIFGMPNYDDPSPGLRFLVSSQEKRGPLSLDLEKFRAQIQNKPVIKGLLDPTRDPSFDEILRSLPVETFHIYQWNEFALDITAMDHTTVQPPTNGAMSDNIYAEQIGPHRSSRALAIVHLAIYEAVNAIVRQGPSHKNLRAAIDAEVGSVYTAINASVRAAIAGAADWTLRRLYPKKEIYVEIFMRTLTPLIGENADAIVKGMAVGRAAGNQVLLYRGYVAGADLASSYFTDGSQSDGANVLQKGANNSLDLEPEFATLYPTGVKTDQWQVDPLPERQNTKAIGGFWKFVQPFVLDPQNLFIPSGPPLETSLEFKNAYDDVRIKGGDPFPVGLGARKPTVTTRTGATKPPEPPSENNETFKGEYWAYDATALLCAPPRLYNMIATSIALKEQRVRDPHNFARYLALVNIALADAAIGAWTAKYQHQFARPVTYFRFHRPKDTSADIKNIEWTPLGAPTSNGSPDGANMTPPFPAYPSGHAVFGAALFTMIRSFFCITDIKKEEFKFVSDEYNGFNRGPMGEARPYYERTFESFAKATSDNARSRIYLGIHWQFDGADGIKQGEKIADYVFKNTLNVACPI